MHDVVTAGPATESCGLRLSRSVPYAAVQGHRPLELDLYLPEDGRSPVPVVVHLHGGGWRSGSRHSASPVYDAWTPTPFERLARAGVAVASVDYRLTGEACWPAQLHDAKAAVRWLRTHAGDLGLDPQRIAVWGGSAGGHLAALLALTDGNAELEGNMGFTGVPTTVCAVATWYAPADLAMMAQDLRADPLSADSPEAQLLNAPVPTVLGLARAASPVHHVGSGAPPFLLLHGRDDRTVPCIQSERMRDALRSAGADVNLHSYPGGDHLWLGSQEIAADALARTIAFFKRCLLAEC